MALANILKELLFFNYQQKLNEVQYLALLRPQIIEKFTDHNLEKLCFRSLASTISVLGLEKSCP